MNGATVSRENVVVYSNLDVNDKDKREDTRQLQLLTQQCYNFRVKMTSLLVIPEELKQGLIVLVFPNNCIEPLRFILYRMLTEQKALKISN